MFSGVQGRQPLGTCHRRLAGPGPSWGRGRREAEYAPVIRNGAPPSLVARSAKEIEPICETLH